MPDRFSVRPNPKGFGVFDAGVNSWHGNQDLTNEAANQLAEHLNGAIEAHHARTAPGSRKVKPAKRVVVQVREVWRDATLDWWVREVDDGWHGRVKDSISGKSEWVHAHNIREAP